MLESDASLVGLFLAASFVAVALWEQARPRWTPAASAGPRWRANLTLYALCLGVRLALAPALVASAWIAGGPIMPAPAAGIGVWAHLIAILLMLDLVAYGFHRLLHASDLLWRIHAVHHTDADLDVTTAVRHHPFEVLPLAATSACGLWLGATPIEIALYGGLAFAVQALAHANVALPAWLESALSRIIVTPAFHRLHHSRDARECNANFGEILIVWDRLFGTAVRVQAPAAFGVVGYDAPRFQTVGSMLLQPLRAPQAPSA